MTDGLSRIPLNRNQETTQKSTYQQEIVSETNGNEELPEGTFPINLTLIQKHQQEEPRIIAKYKTGKYHKGSFREGSNIDLNLITYNNNIVIPSKLQSSVLHWYHTYFVHTIMDITEAMILQDVYWPDIRDSV